MMMMMIITESVITVFMVDKSGFRSCDNRSNVYLIKLETLIVN